MEFKMNKVENKMTILKGISAEGLRRLAKEAVKIASHLEEVQPSYKLALLNGIEDKSYDTPSWGWVSSYSGVANIVMDDGTKWVATGHGPRGSASWISTDGFIEFVKVEG
jgi:hypothetical protein